MNEMDDNTIQRMQNILISEPEKDKTLEKIAIVFACMIVGGLIFVPLIFAYYIFQFDLYFLGLMVSSLFTIITHSGFIIYQRYKKGIEDIYDKPKPKEKLYFKEYLKRLKPNIVKDILIFLSSGTLIALVCIIIMGVSLLFNINNFITGIINGFVLASVMILVINSYKKEIKEGTRSLVA